MFTKTRLPQYFFGDDMNRDKLAKNDSILLGTNSIVEDFHASEPNLSRIPSPASSVASTKKLEWDSGADIGYNVYNSFKNSRRSKSFPTLNMDLSISQINKSDETQGDEISMENKMTDDKENSNINYQCSSQLKSQENKRKSNFKHSTPYEDKMVSKVSKTFEKDKIKSTNRNKDESLQTTPVHICSRSVQTDDNLINDNQKVNKSQQTDTIRSQSSSSGNSLSKSSSFQYIPGSNKSKSSTENSDTARTNSSHKTESKQSNSESTRSEPSKNNSETSSSTKTHSEESYSSHSSPLGKIISTQQSKHLITDIDKSLHILQKFINSKNYTADTKKYYARKIVSKIIASKYTEDSSTSNSTLSTNKSSEKPIEPNIINKSSNDSKDVSNYNKKDKENIKSEKVSCGVQCDPVRKNVSTETDDNKKITEKLEELIYINDKFTQESKHKIKPDSHLDMPNKNWKDAETLSEKLFETRKKQRSHSSINTSERIENVDKSKKNDYLIQHSKNEKKRQLSWINNEISYLHRLQELLQKNDSSSNASIVTETKNKSRHQSLSSDKNISSSLSDIEIKFYQEFGSSNSSNVTGNMENLKKLSEYLTNDQIKFLIDNDAKKLHCQTCECCKQKNVETSKTVQNKSRETNKNKISLKEFVSHDIHNCSFNSHNYKFYENLIKSCNASKHYTPIENSHIHKNLVSEKSDAGIQCTLKKKKHHPQILTDDSTTTEFSKDSLNDKKNVEMFYKNVSNFHHSDSQSTEYGRMESEIVPDYKRTPNTGKENNFHLRRPIKYRSKQTKPQPIAYFLTFEEESMCEYSKNKMQQQKPLENVKVKVPKYPIRHRSNPEGNQQNFTLKDHLIKNRPGFVRSADWRRNIVSNQTERKSKNIFTCSQMKELTSKKYNRLPEVQSKLHVCKILDQKIYNRSMAKQFSKKLQKKTLQGHLSIATCINVMSSE